jgi:hypothetical protein
MRAQPSDRVDRKPSLQRGNRICGRLWLRCIDLRPELIALSLQGIALAGQSGDLRRKRGVLRRNVLRKRFRRDRAGVSGPNQRQAVNPRAVLNKLDQMCAGLRSVRIAANENLIEALALLSYRASQLVPSEPTRSLVEPPPVTGEPRVTVFPSVTQASMPAPRFAAGSVATVYDLTRTGPSKSPLQTGLG